MNAQFVIVLFAALAVAVSGQFPGYPARRLAAETLSDDLQKLAACGGPEYTLYAFIWANRQVSDSIYYKISAILNDHDYNHVPCLIEIQSQPWVNNEKITLECKGHEKLTKSLNEC